MVGALAKVSGQYTSTGVLLLFQNALCFLFILPVACGRLAVDTDRQDRPPHPARNNRHRCWYALFVAITLIPLSNATLLTYSAPLWMPLIAWAVSRQQVSRATCIGAAIAFPYRYAPAEKVGPFIYSVIVFTALIDWIVWNHRPTLFMYLGMALVIGGGLVAVRAKPQAPLVVIDA